MFRKLFGGSSGDGGAPPPPREPRSPHEDAIREIYRIAKSSMMEKNPLFTFKDAFLRKEGFVQRDWGKVQQVIDEKNGIQFELEDSFMLIALKETDISAMVNSLKHVIRDVFRVEAEFRRDDSFASMPNLHRAEFRVAPDTLHLYRIITYSGVVPGGGGTEVEGTHVALSYELGW